MRTTKEKLAQLDASEEKNRQRAIAWKISRYEARLHELMAKGVHKARPDITERYENELNRRLYKQYRPEILEEEEEQ